MDILTDIGLYLIKIIFDLYILAIILRILLQLVKINYDAPFKDFIFNLTDIPLKFIEKIIPKVGNVNISAILLAILLKITELALLDILIKKPLHLSGLSIWTFTSLLTQILNLYFYLVLFRVFISWLAPQHQTRVISTLDKLTCPLLKPLRRIIPSIGGFDLSLIVALILLQLAIIAVVGPLTQIAMKFTFGF